MIEDLSIGGVSFGQTVTSLAAKWRNSEFIFTTHNSKPIQERWKMSTDHQTGITNVLQLATSNLPAAASNLQ